MPLTLLLGDLTAQGSRKLPGAPAGFGQGCSTAGRVTGLWQGDRAVVVEVAVAALVTGGQVRGHIHGSQLAGWLADASYQGFGKNLP